MAAPLRIDLTDVSAGVLGPSEQGVQGRPFRMLSHTPGQGVGEPGIPSPGHWPSLLQTEPQTP